MKSLAIYMKNKFPLKLFLLAVLLVFSVVSTSGVLIFQNMSPEGHANCPFMQHTESICPMNFVDHVGHWQSIFTALPAETVSSLALMLLAALILSFVVAIALSPPKVDAVGKLYLASNPDNRRFNYFIKFFSKGVLHPRLYS